MPFSSFLAIPCKRQCRDSTKMMSIVDGFCRDAGGGKAQQRNPSNIVARYKDANIGPANKILEMRN